MSVFGLHWRDSRVVSRAISSTFVTRAELLIYSVLTQFLGDCDCHLLSLQSLRMHVERRSLLKGVAEFQQL